MLQEQVQEQAQNRTEEEDDLSLQAGESEDVEDPLLHELLTVSRWKGRTATLRDALDDLRSFGLDDAAIRRRLRDLGKDSVGRLPYDLRDLILGRAAVGGKPSTNGRVQEYGDYDTHADQQAASMGVSRKEYDDLVVQNSSRPRSQEKGGRSVSTSPAPQHQGGPAVQGPQRKEDDDEKQRNAASTD